MNLKAGAPADTLAVSDEGLAALGLRHGTGPGQGHEPDRDDGSSLRFAIRTLDNQQEFLFAEVPAHRDDHPSSAPELGEQRLGHEWRRSGDDDAVERCLLRPALVLSLIHI